MIKEYDFTVNIQKYRVTTQTLTGAGGVRRVAVRSVEAGPAGADAGCCRAGAGVGRTRGAQALTLLRLEGPRTAGYTKPDKQNTVRTTRFRV